MKKRYGFLLFGVPAFSALLVAGFASCYSPDLFPQPAVTTSLRFDGGALFMREGETAYVTVFLRPNVNANGDPITGTVTWSSSDAGAAVPVGTVNNLHTNGTADMEIRAVAPGSAVITAAAAVPVLGSPFSVSRVVIVLDGNLVDNSCDTCASCSCGPGCNNCVDCVNCNDCASCDCPPACNCWEPGGTCVPGGACDCDKCYVLGLATGLTVVQGNNFLHGMNPGDERTFTVELYPAGSRGAIRLETSDPNVAAITSAPADTFTGSAAVTVRAEPNSLSAGLYPHMATVTASLVANPAQRVSRQVRVEPLAP